MCFYNNELAFAPLDTKKIKKTVKNIPNGNLVFQKILAMEIFLVETCGRQSLAILSSPSKPSTKAS